MEPKKRRKASIDPTIAAAIEAVKGNTAQEKDGNAEDPLRRPDADCSVDQIPLNVIFSLMKEVLPDDLKVSNNVKTCMQDCVNELVMFLTQEASEYCATYHKKILTAEDLIYAMETLGFGEHYITIMRMILYGRIDLGEEVEK